VFDAVNMGVKLAERINLAPAHFRAAVEPSSWNDETRTVELCWSTGAEVTRYDWERGKYIEGLSLEPKHVRLGRLNGGASVLDNHNAWGGVRSILGVVERAWLDKGEGRCLVRFSEREDVADIVRDVKAGIIRHVSIGYRVMKFRDDTEKDSTVKRLTAIDWEPFEVSLVTIPADAKAGVRSADQQSQTNPCDVYVREETMSGTTFGAGLDEQRTVPVTPPPAAPVAPAAPTVDVDAVRAEAVRAERQRVSEIEEHCRAANLDAAAIRRLVDLGRPLSGILTELRAAYADGVNTRGNGDAQISNRVSVGTEDITLKRAAIETALFHRMNPSIAPPTELGEMRGRSIIDLMRFGIAAKDGHREAMRLSKDEVIKRSLHTTSDFTVLLTESGRRTLRAAYEAFPTTYQRWTKQGTLRDFKTTKRVQIGDAPALEVVVEGAKLKYGTTGESSESITLASYAKAISLSFQAITNDDLEAFSRLVQAQARQVAILAETLATTELTAGTVGGSSIYSTSNPNRLNYTEGAGALSVLTADAAGITALNRLAALMQAQTSVEGDYLNIQPKFLHVPTTLGVIASQLVAAIQVTAQNLVNPLRGQIEVVVNPRLNGSAAVYYLTADPNQIDTVEVAWLDGNVGPQFDMEESFESRGVSFSVWADVTAKAIDFRGMAKSKGAS
jgi:HK97 family phage prohead protease